jgi:hypothetical protein
MTVSMSAKMLVTGMPGTSLDEKISLFDYSGEIA